MTEHSAGVPLNGARYVVRTLRALERRRHVHASRQHPAADGVVPAVEDDVRR